MEWTTQDTERLLSFKKTVDSDAIKVKEKIKKILLDNRYITHVLNNLELEESDAEPDDYYGINIMPYYLIPSTQTVGKNYLCYEVGYKNLENNNKSIKLLQITFYILCYQLTILDPETGLARHDLLSALVQDQFNYTNYFGEKIRLISNSPSTTDNDYASRTLIFEQITDNNLVKTKNGVSRLANKDIIID